MTGKHLLIPMLALVMAIPATAQQACTSCEAKAKPVATREGSGCGGGTATACQEAPKAVKVKAVKAKAATCCPAPATVAIKSCDAPKTASIAIATTAKPSSCCQEAPQAVKVKATAKKGSCCDAPAAIAIVSPSKDACCQEAPKAVKTATKASSACCDEVVVVTSVAKPVADCQEAPKAVKVARAKVTKNACCDVAVKTAAPKAECCDTVAVVAKPSTDACCQEAPKATKASTKPAKPALQNIEFDLDVIAKQVGKEIVVEVQKAPKAKKKHRVVLQKAGPAKWVTLTDVTNTKNVKGKQAKWIAAVEAADIAKAKDLKFDNRVVDFTAAPQECPHCAKDAKKAVKATRVITGKPARSHVIYEVIEIDDDGNVVKKIKKSTGAKKTSKSNKLVHDAWVTSTTKGGDAIFVAKAAPNLKKNDTIVWLENSAKSSKGACEGCKDCCACCPHSKKTSKTKSKTTSFGHATLAVPHLAWTTAAPKKDGVKIEIFIDGKKVHSGNHGGGATGIWSTQMLPTALHKSDHGHGHDKGHGDHGHGHDGDHKHAHGDHDAKKPTHGAFFLSKGTKDGTVYGVTLKQADKAKGMQVKSKKPAIGLGGGIGGLRLVKPTTQTKPSQTKPKAAGRVVWAQPEAVKKNTTKRKTIRRKPAAGSFTFAKPKTKSNDSSEIRKLRAELKRLQADLDKLEKSLGKKQKKSSKKLLD